MDFEEIQAKAELAKHLSSDNIKKLISYIDPPAGLFEDVSEGYDFIYQLKQWKEHNSFKFYQGLSAIGRPDLIPIALKLPWLCSKFPASHDTSTEPELSLKTFVNIFKTEIQKKEWLLFDIDMALKFEAKIEILLKRNIFTADLNKLIKLMTIVDRVDLANKISLYKPLFMDISDHVFINKLKKEVESQAKDLEKWKNSLKDFVTLQSRKVKQALDDEDPVDLESVYIPLTIIKEKPRVIKFEDETTYNEIEYLRKIAEKEVEVVSIDFKEEMKQYDASNPEIWCLIGNPGSGKTFLCHRTALRFGKGQLPQFIYSISIPCRIPEWHAMETSRMDAKLSIDSVFIQKWLCLGMPIGPSWTSDLAEHLVETEGRYLLLIVDSMDEFVKEVPFEGTLLFLLLSRRTLTHCTILLTSRPGAYTDISSTHTLLIDRFYNVLGFSPENRDLYFATQLKDNDEKLDEWHTLIHLHDEINKLSLVPVNASLFATLVKETDKVSAQTLTQLYSQLISYLIRRQLFRIGLKAIAKKTAQLSQLHPSVGDCLKRIGQIAYQGVAFRVLTSSEYVSLRIGRKEKACQCLGLVVEYLRKDSMGMVKKVWSFAHLTIQEFVGAFWLSSSSWGDQCLSIRYIANSPDNFNLFRMVVRFVCGLLSHSAREVLHILYKHLPNTPIQNMPMYYLLNYDKLNMHSYMGWTEFTEKYLTLSALLFESSSDSIYDCFPRFKQFLPQAPCFYFEGSTVPNEWKCFTRSLRFLHSIRIIYCNMRYLTLSEFRTLLAQTTSCSLSHLAVSLYGQNYSTLKAYSDVIRESQLPSNTEISLEIIAFKFADTESADQSSASTFQLFTNLRFFRTQLSPQCLQQIANQLIYTQNLFISSPNSGDYDTLLPFLNTASQLTGLYLWQIPAEHMQQLENILPQLSNLQEIGLRALGDPYSLLPILSNLSRLNYLELQPDSEPTETNVKCHLLKILNTNCHSLRGLMLPRLHGIGLNTWDELLFSLLSCTNLVQIQIWNTKLEHDDVTLWGTAVSRLKSLLFLYLHEVPLKDAGMLSLCVALLHHPTIRRLAVLYCELRSDSCLPLIHLIPTLTQLERLDLKGNNLSKSDPNPVKLLKSTAQLYSVSLLGVR